MTLVRNFPLILLYLIYLFHISFAPFPTQLRTRLILGIFGICCITYLFVTKKEIQLNKNIFPIISFLLGIILFSITTSIINLSLDIWFIQYAVQSMFFLLAAYFVILITFNSFKSGLKFLQLIKFIVLSIVVHNIITIILFLVPSANSFFTSIQNYDELASSTISNVSRFSSRFIGLGIGSFFSGGLLCGYGILLSTYIIKNSPENTQKIKYIFVFLFLTISSLFIARTSLIGSILGLTYLLWPQDLKIYINKRTIVATTIFYTFILTIIVSISFYIFFYPPAWFKANAVEQAFELFTNISSSGQLQTKSTNALQEMYIFPDNIKTWIIGDGQFNLNGGMTYYMLTDVGYSRLLFYFGILGTSMFLGLQIILVFIIGKLSNSTQIKRMMFLSITYSLILNLKGLADVNFYLYLLLWFFIFTYNIESKRSLAETKN